MPNPKRQHYLPAFYLKGFTRDGLLWLYDRQKDEYRRQPPHNTAVIGHYYTTSTDSGERDYSVENHLATVEAEAKPVIAKLEAGEDITVEERVEFAYFLALLLSRTPKHERELEEIGDAMHKLLAKEMIPSVEAAAAVLKQCGGCSETTPESFFRFVHEERFHMKASRDFSIEVMLDHALKFSKSLALMDWLIVHADGHASFITSDSPLGYIVGEKERRSREPVLGLASEKVTKLIPLTCQTAMVIGGFGARFGHFSVDRNQVREINEIVSIECERFVIGRDEALLRSLIPKCRVDRERPGSTMRVENVPHPSDPLRSFLVTRRVAADDPSTPLPVEFFVRKQQSPKPPQNDSENPT